MGIFKKEKPVLPVENRSCAPRPWHEVLLGHLREQRMHWRNDLEFSGQQIAKLDREIAAAEQLAKIYNVAQALAPKFSALNELMERLGK